MSDFLMNILVGQILLVEYVGQGVSQGNWQILWITFDPIIGFLQGIMTTYMFNIEVFNYVGELDILNCDLVSYLFFLVFIPVLFVAPIITIMLAVIIWAEFLEYLISITPEGFLKTALEHLSWAPAVFYTANRIFGK